MLHSYTKIAAITLAALAFFSPVANATVTLPALQIDNFTGDVGFVSDGTNLTVDATVFSILVDNGPPISAIDIADQVFSLTATYSGVSGSTYTFINGTLMAGSYLSADFSTLDIISLGGGSAVYSAVLNYTGGSLIGGLTSGNFEGGFVGASGNDFSQAFTAVNITGAKAGAVVPVPAAVWLFGSGLLGLVGVARRKAA